MNGERRRTITVLAALRAAAGKADELARVLAEQVGVVRSTEAGCLVYTLHRSARDPHAFLFYEVYADQAAFDAHRASPHLASYRKRREDEGLVDGPVDVAVYDTVAG